MQNLNESLQAKYPHLELAALSLSQVNKDNEKNRIDAEFFNKNFIRAYEKIKKLGYVYLEDCLSVLTDYHSNGSYEILNANVKIKDEKDYAYMIRSTDCEKMDFENEVKYVSQHAYNFLSKTQIFGGEVLINKIGSPGSSYFVPYLNKPTTLGMNLFLLKTNDKLNNAFLYIFLNTKIGKLIIERKINGAVPQTIDKEAIKTLPIPLFPKPFQLEIEKLVKQSHEALEDSKRLYKEAQELLYKELELDFKNPLKSLLKSSLQAKKPSELTNINDISKKYPHLNISVRPLSKSLHKSGRLDSEYYQSKYDLMENKIKDYKGGYCKLQPSEIKDSNFTPKAQEKYRYIELANIGNNGNISEPLEDFGENLPTRARRKVKTDDFIMSSIEGSLTSCALITPEFDNCVVSTGFYVLNSAQLNGETLLVLFKCEFFQEYLKKFPSGTILTAISKDELQNILIPKIATATQEQIALKIQKSFTLRAKSKDLLQNAKIKLENAIENFCDI